MARGFFRNLLLRLNNETIAIYMKPNNVDKMPAPEINPYKATKPRNILPKKYPLKNILAIDSEL